MGKVLLPSKQIEVLVRRGVDGTGIREVGSLAGPFTLRGSAFHASHADAKDAIESLEALKGHDYGIKLTKKSIDYGRFDVVEVMELDDPRDVAAAAGALIANPAVLAIYSITLLHRPEPEV